MGYELFYWPNIQGRGEFVRLVLEEAGTEYRDVARDEGGDAVLPFRFQHEASLGLNFAPPALRIDGEVLSQTVSISEFVAVRHGLIGESELERAHARELALTVADVVLEAHDTHHPVDISKSYDEQREPSLRRSRFFCQTRLGDRLRYFEEVLKRSRFDPDAITYAHLHLFQLLEGLAYAFPRSMAVEQGTTLEDFRTAIGSRPRIARYLKSERRIDFNEDGIFRHYPELDQPSGE